MISEQKKKKRKLSTSTEKQKKSDANTHKKSLEKLKDTDPEFFKFLNNESKELLNFSMSESEGEDDNGNEGSTSEAKSAKTNGKSGKSKAAEDDSVSEADSDEDDTHRPPQKLLVQSDSEDEEEDMEAEEEESEDEVPAKRRKDTRQVVTTAMINEWTQKLRQLTELSSGDNVLADVVQAFCAAVQQAGAKADKDKEKKASLNYKVEGSIVFNAIVRLVVTELLPTLSRILNLPKSKHKSKFPSPTQSKLWPSVKSAVRQYLSGLLQLVSSMAEADVVNALLKHTFQALSYFAQFPKIIKLLLRQLIVTWSRGEESSRVLAFLCINRIVRFHNKHLLDFALKKMYTSHVKNCRFVTPTTLPLISFMQRSLAELFSINFTLSYQFAFIYIRQLAIHLRNAITVKKKDTQQVVYSWQFIHSLHFWSRTLSQLQASDALKPLIYPLTQVILGTARLIPSARYYPLRFQCVRMLTQLSEATGTFIPVLPLITEVFELSNFNKKHKSLSLKPFNFACILKFSNAQLDDKAFKDGVIDQVYELLMSYLHVYSHTIAFPELVLPLTIQVRKFLKTCKVANYTKQLKQIVDKVEETAKVMTERRREAALNLADAKSVTEWERKSKDEGTPLSKYFATWRKLRDQELQMEASSKEHISMDDLPVIVRPKGPLKASEEEKQEFADIFKSDDEGSDDETRFLLKEERDKKSKKKTKKRADSDDDNSSDYSDFNEEELEQLAKSASEGEDSEDDVDSDSEAEDNDSEDEDESDVEENASGAKGKGQKGANKPAVSQNKKGCKQQVAIDNGPDEDDIVEDFEMSSEDEQTNAPTSKQSKQKVKPKSKAIIKDKRKPTKGLKKK